MNPQEFQFQPVDKLNKKQDRVSLASLRQVKPTQPFLDSNKTTSSLDQIFSEFLELDAGDGKVSPDTLKNYQSQIQYYFNWCISTKLNPLLAEKEDIKKYRKSLIESNFKFSTIELKLTVVKRFYDACVDRGLIVSNPAKGVKAPIQNTDEALNICYLELDELKHLLEAAKSHPRDLLIISLMALQGLRTIEVQQLNIPDFIFKQSNCYLTVSSKRSQRTIKLREDVKEFYLNYLIATGRTGSNRQGALITSLSPNNRKNRISRRGIRYIVDNYLKQLNLKQKTNLKGDLISLSDHSLRHTFATLVYQQTQDLKLLQQALGHNDPRTTAKYAHVGNAIAAADAIQL